MDCKTTSITKRCAGVSIIETWFAVGIFALLMAALASFCLYTSKSFAGLINYVDLEQKSQMALDTMTKEIRQTQCLTSITNNQLIFLDGDNVALSYTYNPTTRTLIRGKGGTNKTLLTECDFLCFSNFQRNPVEGAYEQYPVTISPTNTKLVSVTWVCSRQIIGSKLNTESVQTAKIVIRKQ